MVINIWFVNSVVKNEPWIIDFRIFTSVHFCVFLVNDLKRWICWIQSIVHIQIIINTVHFSNWTKFSKKSATKLTIQLVDVIYCIKLNINRKMHRLYMRSLYLINICNFQYYNQCENLELIHLRIACKNDRND